MDRKTRKEMPIKVNNFMGSFGWYMRKHFPLLASNAYLKLQFMKRGKTQRAYTEWFLNRSEVPMPNVVNIETVNRCNSTCAFCTANKNAEKRPFLKMEEDLYYSIIDQLADWGYKGHLTLYGNNEPWLDPRIVAAGEFHLHVDERVNVNGRQGEADSALHQPAHYQQLQSGDEAAQESAGNP